MSTTVINVTMYQRWPAWVGAPAGGSTGDFLKKNSDANYDYSWGAVPWGGDMISTNNLSDLTDVAQARSNLSLGTASVANTGTSEGDVPVLSTWGKLDASLMPSVAISEYINNFADLATALADASVQAWQRGDWFTVSTDWWYTYIITTDSPTNSTHVKLMKTPSDNVTSVNGDTWVLTGFAKMAIASVWTAIQSFLGAIGATVVKYTTDTDSASGFGYNDWINNNYPVACASVGAGAGDAGWDPFYEVKVPNQATTWGVLETKIKVKKDVVEITDQMQCKWGMLTNAQTGTSYTLVIGDAGKLVTMDNASSNTLTIPPNSSVAFKVWATIFVEQEGAGQTTIAPWSGVTIESANDEKKIGAQYGGVYLRKKATDTRALVGNLTA